jgi:FAD synthetase
VQLYSANFKEEVQKLIDSQHVKAIVMGNRRSDPWSRDLESICHSSAGWPFFYRVFPILDWSYHDVWSFLKGFELPYCSLYDEGYTSLGETDNSIKNPHLRVVDRDENGVEVEKYQPAYLLKDETFERESRKTH